MFPCFSGFGLLTGVKNGGGNACFYSRAGFNYSKCLRFSMQQVVIFERSSKHFSRFIDLLKTQAEISIKDVKKLCSHSSYYAIIIRKLYSINNILREINPNVYLAEPHFTLTPSKDQVLTSLKRCELIDIDARKEFFIVRLKHA